MRKTKTKESIKQKLKRCLRLRIKSLQSEKGQFARNPAFASNVKTANIEIIEGDISTLQELLSKLL